VLLQQGMTVRKPNLIAQLSQKNDHDHTVQVHNLFTVQCELHSNQLHKSSAHILISSIKITTPKNGNHYSVTDEPSQNWTLAARPETQLTQLTLEP